MQMMIVQHRIESKNKAIKWFLQENRNKLIAISMKTDGILFKTTSRTIYLKNVPQSTLLQEQILFDQKLC
jgi:hypothetical protein